MPIFDTFALAEAYAPSVAPDWIQTVFYDENQVSNSGAKYRKNGGTDGDLVITLTDGVTDVGYDIQNGIINAAAFGLSASNTPSQNKAILKAVVTRTATNGRFIVPDLGGPIVVDTAGGLSDAPEIDRRLICQIDGHLKASTGNQTSNPPCIFNVTAANVIFDGSGTIEGDGTTHVYMPNGSDATCPRLVRVSGAGFVWRGIRILKPSQIGIDASNADRARFSDFLIEGGHVGYEPSTIVDPDAPDFGDPNPSYAGSYHPGILTSGADFVEIDNVNSTPGIDGGRITMTVFSSGDSGNGNSIRITNCTADRPWEKLAYLYGDDHLVEACTVVGTFDSYQRDCFTDSFRIMGNRGKITKCKTRNTTSGIQMLGGYYNQAIDNEFINCVGVAIVMMQLDGQPAAPSNCEAEGNFCAHNGDYEGPNTAGILFYSGYADILQPSASNNRVLGYGRDEDLGAIHIECGSPYNVYQPKVHGNVIVSYATGIKLRRAFMVDVDATQLRGGSNIGILADGCDGGTVSRTTGIDVGVWALANGGTSSAGNIEWIDNDTRGATNIGIRGVTSGPTSNGSSGRGNKYRDGVLLVPVTLDTTSDTTTVTHGGIAPNAVGVPIPRSTAFAQRFSSQGYTIVASSGNFVVVNVDGNAGPVDTSGIVQIVQ